MSWVPGFGSGLMRHLIPIITAGHGQRGCPVLWWMAGSYPTEGCVQGSGPERGATRLQCTATGRPLASAEQGPTVPRLGL